MGKVVTSEGIVEFVQTGKFTQVPDHKPKSSGDAPPLEVKQEAPVLDVTPEKPVEGVKPAAPVAEHDEELTAEEKELPEKAQKEIQRAKRAVNKKHAEMKAAQEELAESERFGETQFNEKRLLEQRLATAESELEGLKPPKPVEPEAKAPVIADYTNAQGQVDWDKYTDAKAEYAADKAVKAERAKQAEERAATERVAAEAQVRARADKARAAHSDFDEVMQSVKGTGADRVPQFVLNYIFESENAGEIAYHLAKHPEVSQRIAKLSPIRGIAELGKLEDSLIKPSAAATAPAANGATVPSQRGAPPPITPLSGAGSGSVNTDPAKMTYKELRAYERSRDRSKH